MDRAQEAARYQRAAQSALDQLEWCVRYLERIRKYDIAKQVEKNRAAISRRLR